MSTSYVARYVGDDRVETTHGPTGHALATDLPRDNGGLGRTFSPTDLVAVAFANCVLTIMGRLADREGVDLEGARFELAKTMQTGPRRVGRIAGRIVLPPTVDAALLKKLAHCVDACPVRASLHPDVEVEVSVEVEAGVDETPGG